MSVQEQAAVVSAMMRAMGVTKLRVPEDFLVDTAGAVVTVWHDRMSGDRVFTLRLPGEVIEDEEVPFVAAIEGAGHGV